MLPTITSIERVDLAAFPELSATMSSRSRAAAKKMKKGGKGSRKGSGSSQESLEESKEGKKSRESSGDRPGPRCSKGRQKSPSPSIIGDYPSQPGPSQPMVKTEASQGMGFQYLPSDDDEITILDNEQEKAEDTIPTGASENLTQVPDRTVSPGDRSRSPRERLPGVSGPLQDIWDEQRGLKTQKEELMDICDSEESIHTTVSEGRGTSRRGRPPTSGLYIGVGRARNELLKRKHEDKEKEVIKRRLVAEREEMEERAHMGLPPARPPQQNSCKRSTHAAPPSNRTGEDSSDEELRKAAPRETMKRLEASAAVISDVVRKSKRMKGTCQKEINDAVTAILEEASALRDHSRTEENRRLERINKNLRREMEELRRDMEELRKAWRTKETPPPKN